MATKDSVMVEVDDDLPEKKEPDEIVIVEDKPDTGDRTQKVEPETAEEQRETANARTEEEREAIRERRRQEKLDRKQRKEVAISRDKLEMDFLRKRNEDLERRLDGVETHTFRTQLQDVDRQIKHHSDEVRMADQVIAKAIAAGNGEDVVKAMKYRDEALARVNQLSYTRQNAVPPQKPNPGLDDRVALHAKEFLEENKWYDIHGRDEDSAIVLAIDSALIKDGYDPKSEDYWTELRKRAARRLPEKFSAREEPEPTREERRPRGGPNVGSGREHAPTSTRREIYISPERKQALVDAGVWDDPVLRQRYVKRYAEYDRTNRA
jgi:hypothetical protein